MRTLIFILICSCQFLSCSESWKAFLQIQNLHGTNIDVKVDDYTFSNISDGSTSESHEFKIDDYEVYLGNIKWCTIHLGNRNGMAVTGPATHYILDITTNSYDLHE